MKKRRKKHYWTPELNQLADYHASLQNGIPTPTTPSLTLPCPNNPEMEWVLKMGSYILCDKKEPVK